MTFELRNIAQPQHTHADVRAVTGLSPARLQNWANRSVVKLGQQNPGRQGKRLSWAVDITQLVAMAELTKVGVSAATAADFAEGGGARRRWPKKPNGAHKAKRSTALVNGRFSVGTKVKSSIALPKT